MVIYKVFSVDKLGWALTFINLPLLISYMTETVISEAVNEWQQQNYDRDHGYMLQLKLKDEKIGHAILRSEAGMSLDEAAARVLEAHDRRTIHPDLRDSIRNKLEGYESKRSVRSTIRDGIVETKRLKGNVILEIELYAHFMDNREW